MTERQIHVFFERIDKLNPDQKPSFGKMNANQMVCHCTDQIRLAMGSFKAKEYGALTPKEVFALSNAGKTVPTAKGMDQVNGDGTKPTIFKDDIETLKEHIVRFSELDDNFEFGLHPYFGHLTKEKWARLTHYHLDYHLKQFNA